MVMTRAGASRRRHHHSKARRAGFGSRRFAVLYRATWLSAKVATALNNADTPFARTDGNAASFNFEAGGEDTEVPDLSPGRKYVAGSARVAPSTGREASIAATEVVDIRPGEGMVAVDTVREGRTQTRLAQVVVLASGFVGGGRWRVPDFISASLPPDRYDHTNGPIDFARPIRSGTCASCHVRTSLTFAAISSPCKCS
jgi:hypothetical protein